MNDYGKQMHRLAAWLAPALIMACGRAETREVPAAAAPASPTASAPQAVTAPAKIAAPPPSVATALSPEAKTPEPVQTAEVCVAVCRHAARLRCGTSEACAQGCQAMLAIPPCQERVAAFFECIAKEPIEHWECDSESMTPAIKDGFCDAPQEAFMGCVEQGS